MLKQSHRFQKAFQRSSSLNYRLRANVFIPNRLVIRPDVEKSGFVKRNFSLAALIDAWFVAAWIGNPLESIDETLSTRTYRHERPRRSRHISRRIESRSSCHSKSYQFSIQTVCRRERRGTCCTRSRLHASVCLCSSSPVVEKRKQIEKLSPF